MNKFSVYFFTCSNNKMNFMSAGLEQCFVSWLGNWVHMFHPLVQRKKTPENTCWTANLQMVICLSNLLVKTLPMLGPVALWVLDREDPFCSSVQKFFQSQIVSRLPRVWFFVFQQLCFLLQDHFFPHLGLCAGTGQGQDPWNWAKPITTSGLLVPTIDSEMAKSPIPSKRQNKTFTGNSGKESRCLLLDWVLRNENLESWIPSLSLQKEPFCRSWAKKDWLPVISLKPSFSLDFSFKWQ